MMRGSRFEALDAWRGICAVIVVVFHFVAMMPSSLEGSMFIRNGFLFVDFFFLLSGFVLCHSYRSSISSVGDLRRFAIRRFGRVWPVHAVVLGVFVAVVAVVDRLPHPAVLSLTPSGGAYSLDALIPSVLLLNAMGLTPQGTVWNGPAWSIGAEFYVYLLFAVLLVAASRRLLATCLALSISALTLGYLFAPALMNATWDYGFIRCIASFFGGVVAYHVHETVRERSLMRATLWEAGAAALVVAFVIHAGNGADDVSALSLAAPLVFGAAVVTFAGEQGALSLLLKARPFRALGRYSFSIYMIHMPLLVILCYGLWAEGYGTKEFGIAGARPWMGSVDLILVDFVLAVIVIAAASHRFIEVPARGAFNRIADGEFILRRPAREQLAFD
ncbi:MAG: acyltransferase [Proteobacteria bacterium]|nr:acyltransferase [Pseudomonadota bacterium]